MNTLTIQRIRRDLSRTFETVHRVARVDGDTAVWLDDGGGGSLLLSHPEDNATIERVDDWREFIDPGPEDEDGHRDPCEREVPDRAQAGFDYAMVQVNHCAKCRALSGQ